jgi:hypothetical protein
MFQKDSHMRMEFGWDGELLENISLCKNPLKSLITMYPEAYERSEKKNCTEYRVSNRRGTRKLILNDPNEKDGRSLFNGDGLIEFASHNSHDPIPNVPPRVPMYSGNFAFAHSSVFKKVPYSPHSWLLGCIQTESIFTVHENRFVTIFGIEIIDPNK